MPALRAKLAVHAPPTRVRLTDRSLDEIASELAARRVRPAREEGFAEGRRNGAAESATLFDAAVARLEDERVAREEQASAWAVRFAVEIARHLLRREVTAGHYDVEQIVRETLARSGVGRGA